MNSADPPQTPGILGGPSYLLRAVRAPIQTFIHTEEVGAIILLAAAAAALGWANSPWSDTYVDFWHTYISIDIYVFAISEDLGHLVNEGLMAVFFFVVGLEIKRELLHGELSSPRKAALPVVAAVGGMATPAVIYLLMNPSGESTVGWGVPVATDIAFALGVLALLGRRIPGELRVFLLGLAVVDDLGAIAIIATFYTDAIHWTNLGLGLAFFGLIAICLRLGIRSMGFYLILCVLMWQFFLESGIHATLAGVMVAAIVPSAPSMERRKYADAADSLLHDFRLAMANGDEERAQTLVEQVEELSRGTEGPMERLERIVHPWVSFVVIPLFALANAGIVLTTDAISAAVTSSITLGVAIGLLAGNPLGVVAMTWLAVRIGLGELPSSVTWWHILGTGFLAGIGFTVAIFVAGIAFTDPEQVDQAKMGIFGASVIAGLTGYLVLRTAGSGTADRKQPGRMASTRSGQVEIET